MHFLFLKIKDIVRIYTKNRILYVVESEFYYNKNLVGNIIKKYVIVD